jgi:4-phosphopantoate--beta-alanine ligase
MISLVHGGERSIIGEILLGSVVELTVPRSHPRYISLTTRDNLVEGWKNGLVVTQGLIAHGRGEAFDYLIGEVTTPEADKATVTAASMLLHAERPVVSVNGNVGALAAGEIARICDLLRCPAEVNIFHRTEERVGRLVEHLKNNGCKEVLGIEPDARLDGLDHARALCSSKGILISDVVLVPLEDGDRCQALKSAGKKVITIDLNPMSRTAVTADVTIVDNLIRAMPNLIEKIEIILKRIEQGDLSKEKLREEFESYSNDDLLKVSLRRMVDRFS